MKTGYYWIEFGNEKTIGYYDSFEAEDYAWVIIGSDEIFEDDEINVLQRVKEM